MKKAIPELRRCGYIFAIASLQFIIAMILVQLYFQCNSNGCYNAGTNPISDLGNTATSAQWPVFNYSIVLFGLMIVCGIALAFGKLAKNTLGKAGLVVIAISALAAAGVGVVPENTILAIHSIFALIAFTGGGLGLLLFGIGVSKAGASKAYAAYSALSGIVILVGIAVFLMPSFGLLPHWNTFGPGFGFGGMERIVTAPLLLWLLITAGKSIKERG